MSILKHNGVTLISAAFVAGASFGALALAGYQHIAPTANTSQSANPPAALDALRQSGAIINALPMSVAGLQAWELSSEAPEATTQLAISAPGSDAYVIGELFDENGSRLNDELLGAASRERLRYGSLHVRSQWLPVLNAEAEGDPVYLMADLSDTLTQTLWAQVRESAHDLPQLRVIPTPFASVNGFESTLDVFATYHQAGPEAAVNDAKAYLNGERHVSASQKNNPSPHPLAVSAMSTNTNLHHQLRIGTEATVILKTAQGGVELQPFRVWIQKRLGQKSS